MIDRAKKGGCKELGHDVERINDILGPLTPDEIELDLEFLHGKLNEIEQELDTLRETALSLNLAARQIVRIMNEAATESPKRNKTA